MSLGQFELPVRHGRCAQSTIGQTRQHGGEVESAVEAVAEFRGVTRQVVGAGFSVTVAHGERMTFKVGRHRSEERHLVGSGRRGFSTTTLRCRMTCRILCLASQAVGYETARCGGWLRSGALLVIRKVYEVPGDE